MPDWSRYGTSYFRQEDENWWPLTNVAHVTHLPTARRIIEDGIIKRTLVYDKSVLNRTRSTVSWVSPNDWSKGYRYGTVKFGFDWESIVEYKSMYWVEAMETYSPHACRFFITSTSLEGLLSYMKPYDPILDDGPIKKTEKGWLWCRHYTLEIMVDSDLDLTLSKGVEFVKHHPDFCNQHDSSCVEKKEHFQTSGAFFMSFVLGLPNTKYENLFIKKDQRLLSDMARIAINGIYMILDPGEAHIGLTKDLSTAIALTKSAFLQLAYRKRNDAKSQIHLIYNRALFDQAFKACICAHFGLEIFEFA